MKPYVSAVIVAYFPDVEHLSQLICTTSSQVSSIVLVCNSVVDISNLKHRPECTFHVLANSHNVGLATAQNLGIAQSAKENADFLLFLDQDSLPPDNLVERLLAVDAVLTKAAISVGGVGPLLIDADTGIEWPYITAAWIHTRQTTKPNALGVCSADMLYSSGSLIRRDNFKIVGDFMEPLFIDHVDLEWCYRASHFGLRFFGVPSIRMEHRIGDGHVRFLGRLHPKHSASRDYYAFRNSVILIGLPHIPWRWKINEVIRLIPRGIIYGIIGKSTRSHATSFLRAIADGIAYLFNRKNEFP